MLSIFFDHLGEDPQLVAAAREAGLEAVDCSVDDLRRRPAPEMRRFLEECGLACGAVFGLAELSSEENAAFAEGLRTARGMLEDAVVLQAGTVMLVPGYAASPQDKPRAARRMAEGLRILAGEAREKGITLSIENFSQVRTPYATPQEVADLLDAVPGLDYTLDTGNFRCRGIELLEAMELLFPRVSRVHSKDWGLVPRGTAGIHAADGVTLYGAALGEGILPLDAACRRLRERGYTGDWVVEMNNMRITRQDVVRSVAYMKERI